MNVLFTCGGTAGHINPAVALARLFQLRDPDCKVLFVGADGGMETRLVPKEGYDLRTVTITNFRRSFTPAAIGHNLKTVVNMGRSKKQAQRILKEFQHPKSMQMRNHLMHHHHSRMSEDAYVFPFPPTWTNIALFNVRVPDTIPPA